MDNLSQLSRLYASWKATSALDTKQQIIELLIPATTGTGLTNVAIIGANQLHIDLEVTYHHRKWPVRLRATFHGFEVFVSGKDRDGAKRHIAEQFRRQYLGV